MKPSFEVIDLGLVYYRNVITNPGRVIEIIDEVNKRYEAGEGKNRTDCHGWIPWIDEGMDKPFNYRFFIYRKSLLQDTEYFKEEFEELDSLVYGPLDAAFEHYTSLYPLAKASVKSEERGAGVLRYESDGGHLPFHQDLGVSSRVISVVSYFNDDYDGGEIEFRHSHAKIKPEAGSIIFFPSNFLYGHQIHPMKSGTRYSMPHFYHHLATPRISDGTE